MNSRPAQFADLAGLTLRAYRANVAPLTAVAVIITAVSLGISLIGGHGHTRLSGYLFGLGLYSSGEGFGVGFSPLELLSGLVWIVVDAWATASMTVMLLRHLRGGRRARLADLRVRLPYVAWTAVAGLFVGIIGAGLSAPLFVGLGQAWIATIALQLLVWTAIVFYSPLIIDGMNGVSSLYGSWRLVRSAGFLRVLGYLLGAYVLITVFGGAVTWLTSILGSQTLLIVLQVALGLLVTPLLMSYTVVMYLMATGSRAWLLETAIAPAIPESEQPRT